METVITAAAILLAIVGLVLVVDVGRIWRDDPRSIGGPERAQLLTGIAVLVFGVAFFAARDGEDEAPVPALGTTTTATAEPGAAELAKLAAPARLPKLQAPERRPDPRDRDRPRPPRRQQQEEPAAPVQETTTTTTTPTTTTPATTTPAPATTTPAPEPAPPAEETVPFDSRE